MLNGKEKLIVSLTSFGKRLENIPIVLDTIFSQTMLPDKVVLNLAFDEVIPIHVQLYLEKNKIEVFRVPDTKVYKKLIPTLKRYPNDIIISIDDDWLYPDRMIEDFMNIHQRYPNHPISGNRVIFNGLQCHCGCASLTKKEFFGDLLDNVDDDLMSNCPSDDLVYTYLALSSGYMYIRSQNQYFTNMVPYGNEKSYSKEMEEDFGIERTFNYLVNRFGKKTILLSSYLHDDRYLSELLDELYEKNIIMTKREVERRIMSSHAYRLGKCLLKPLSWVKNR